MKKFIVFLIVAFLLMKVNVYAEYNADIYGNIVENSGLEQAKDTLDSETRQMLEENGIDPLDVGWSDNLEPENIIELIVGFIKSGGKKPFTIAVKALGIIILCSLVQHFSSGLSKNSVQYIALVVFLGIIGVELYSLTSVSVKLMKSLSAFMTAFVPVMAAVLSASGKSIAAAGTSGILLFACGMLSNVAAFFIAPAMSGYLAVSMCAGIAENKGIMQFAQVFKKTVMWAFSLAVTLFLGVLSIKGGIGSVEDNLSLKALRYVLGSTVPIAGSVLSESVSSVVYSLTLLRKSAGMYAVAVIAVMVLPVLLQVLCFRISIFVISSIAGLFECNAFSKSVEIFDNMLSLLTGLLLLTFALFVLSLGVVVSL